MARIRPVWLAFAAGVAWSAAFAAHALECPTPQPSGRPGVIAETQSTIADIARLLTGADAAARAGEIVAQVRQRHPGANADEIVNFLVTAYCPVVNAQGLPEAEKVSRINAFSGAVMRQLY
jgi:hypothetical protein